LDTERKEERTSRVFIGSKISKCERIAHLKKKVGSKRKEKKRREMEERRANEPGSLR